jgi:putrescine transport system permease protein
MAVMLPFWTSFLIRVYAWMGLLRDNGLVNHALTSLGLIDAPLRIINTDVAVYIGIVYAYLPFMILPLYATLERVDWRLLDAAADLGCRPLKAFLAITLPLSLPGMLVGALLVFIPVTGEFVIPELLGGPDTLMIGKLLWQEFFNNRDWPVAAALAVLVVAMLLPAVRGLQWAQAAARGRR